MHGAGLVFGWVVLGLGGLAVAFGVWSLLDHLPHPFALARNAEWRTLGWSEVMLGAFAVIQVVPRLANASPHVVFLMTIVAFLPAVGLFWVLRSPAE